MVQSRGYASLKAVLVMAGCLFAGRAQAEFILIGPAVPGGTVEERGPKGTQVIVAWTDKDENELEATDTKVIGDSGVVSFRVPQTSRDINNQPQTVADWKQSSTLPTPRPAPPEEEFAPAQVGEGGTSVLHVRRH